MATSCSPEENNLDESVNSDDSVNVEDTLSGARNLPHAYTSKSTLRRKQLAETYVIGDITFLRKPPDHLRVDCGVCSRVLVSDPNQLSCCGNHVCGICLNNCKQSCLICHTDNPHTFFDKNRYRAINSLHVYCPNYKEGCPWSGKLKRLAIHLRRETRDGECQHEVVQCRHRCLYRKQRHLLPAHEQNCTQRPLKCTFCGYESTFDDVMSNHYAECLKYPSLCPNGCTNEVMPQRDIQDHLQLNCPLQPVRCDLEWAGCNAWPHRGEKAQHNTECHMEHTSLLASVCLQLQHEVKKLRLEKDQLVLQLHNAVSGEFLLLPQPMKILKSTLVSPSYGSCRFYSEVTGYKVSLVLKDLKIELVIHKGSFDDCLVWPFRKSIVMEAGGADRVICLCYKLERGYEVLAKYKHYVHVPLALYSQKVKPSSDEREKYITDIYLGFNNCTQINILEVL